MKRLLAILLVVAMSVALVACTGQAEPAPAAPVTPPAPVDIVAEEPEPEEPELTTGEVAYYEIAIVTAYGESWGTFTGALVEGLPQGQGSFTAVNVGDVSWTYTGSFEDGQFHGYGETLWENGQHWLGRYYRGGLLDGRIYRAATLAYIVENGDRFPAAYLEEDEEYIAATVAVAAQAAADIASAPSAAPTAGLVEARVERVIDGDTIVLVGGERVRFIGIDAPEIGEPGADAATAFVRDNITDGRVWLSSSGADRDRFGRLRRYVWTQEPLDPQDPAQIEQWKLNALLVANGHAVVMIVGQAAPQPPAAAPTPAPPPVPTPSTPPPEPAPPPQEAPDQGVMVWLSATGTRFHSINNCGTMNPARARQMSRDEAQRRGYEACRNCW